MVGIVIVTHGSLGEALIETAAAITGRRPDRVVALSIDGKTDKQEDLRNKVSEAIRSVNGRRKVVILTDMYGGTPCNLSLSFIQKGHVEVISAVNLPILLRAIDARDRMGFTELMNCLESCGKRNIFRAVGVLDGNQGAGCPVNPNCL
jgi:PTS system mannose-specific IIA component